MADPETAKLNRVLPPKRASRMSQNSSRQLTALCILLCGTTRTLCVEPNAVVLRARLKERNVLPPRTKSNDEAAVESLKELLSQQDDKMRELFATAINLFVAPGAADTVDREKIDHLRKAVDDSLN